MAVDRLKVIARLKALFPKANLSQKRLDALADKLASKPADDADDTAIDVVINDFNDILSIEEIAREDDRVRTLEARSKEPNPNPAPPAPAPANPTPANPTPAPSNGDDVPAWAQKLLEKVEAIETGKIIETKKQTAQQVFESSEVFKDAPKEVKEFMLKNIDVNSETSFEDQVKSLEETYGKMVQTTADNSNYSGPAGKGQPSTATDDKLVEDIVNQM